MPETVGTIESKAAGRQYGDVKIKAVKPPNYQPKPNRDKPDRQGLSSV